ncbi:hypothetical protein GN958_ATG10281 [Phytophthora infestans]|uniref:Uncharacterized protein n=1 Tax=Phytophthora infestans TaxID=4787 RepID=A0A8S9UM93_PHYIN|nr:hypothetical protein GN958_ATG10281 [Phytophthora infestans]
MQLKCVFCGREKCTGDWSAPFNELYEEVIWKYDDALCMFGYAVVKQRVCLAIIKKHSTTENPHGAIAEKVKVHVLTENFSVSGFHL